MLRSMRRAARRVILGVYASNGLEGMAGFGFQFRYVHIDCTRELILRDIYTTILRCMRRAALRVILGVYASNGLEGMAVFGFQFRYVLIDCTRELILRDIY